MQYNMYQGVQNDWREQFLSLPSQLRGRNWLPLAVAAGTGLWVALIIMNFQITGPPDLGAPSNAGKAAAGQSINVTNASGSITDAGINGGGTSLATATHNSSNMTAGLSSGTDVAAANTASEAVGRMLDEGDVIGGRGSDETPVLSSEPVTTSPNSPSVEPITVDPSPIIETEPITVGPVVLPAPELPSPDDLLPTL